MDPMTMKTVLSPRETEILGLAAEGFTREETALQLVISLNTVDTHLRHAFEKLGARNTTHAVVLALRVARFAPSYH
jgi:DNA-binding CsgD family transcriptional regulator